MGVGPSTKNRRIWIIPMVVMLAMLLVIAGLTQANKAEATHGGTADLLMLSTTLVDHSTTLIAVEKEQAAVLGMSVDVVSAATWGTMTAAEFASYKAIVLGDPHCVSSGTAPIAAAEANRAVWGPVITGNVIVIGTDPDFHRTQGGAALTKGGINFATAEAGKTGAYITLSCYYFGVPTTSPVPVPVLDEFGTFNVHGQNVPGGTSCPADSHIVATHPAISALTDADLSNWGCSFHEGFVLPLPSDFLVLAIAKDVPSTFVAADGTSGTPYIIARGVEVISDIDLSPDGGVNEVGTDHTVTAHVTTDDPLPGTPVVNTLVTFTVLSGPNAGVTGTATTNASGLASFTYTGSRGVGTDVIVATFVDSSGVTQTSGTVEKHWVDPTPVPPTSTPVPPTPTPTPEPELQGRMTGGGSVPMAAGTSFSGIDIDAKKGGGGKPDPKPVTARHGFTLHCDSTAAPNNRLQVNWGKGNKFHLLSLDSAACSDDPTIDEANPVAGFDTLVGSGTGRYNGVDGATIEFTFTDAGEPGKNDEATMEIKDAGGDVVLTVSAKLKNGNHQAHPFGE